MALRQKGETGGTHPVPLTEVEAAVFGLAAVVIIIGFLGTLFFEKTRIPDILILILLGLVLGPLTGILDPASLTGLTPLFGALALTLILFDSGLDLKYEDVVKKLRSVVILIGASFVVTTLAIAIIYRVLVPTDPAYLDLTLGALLSAVSAPIVIPLLSIMTVKSDTRTVLNLESALTDASAVIVVFVVVASLGPSAGSPSEVAIGLGATLVVSTVVALLLGVAWLELLKLMRNRAYSYMLTLAVVLGLFSVVEFFGGTGPVAALVFGIVLANGKEFSRHLPIKTTFVLDEKIRWFHSEVTFFMKTFFFVYIGLIFVVDRLSSTLFLLSFAILGVIVAARVLAVKVLVSMRPEEQGDQDVLFIMMPRGLTSVVVASTVAATAVVDASILLDVTFIVIILTNVVMTVGVLFAERRRMKAREIPPMELEVPY